MTIEKLNELVGRAHGELRYSRLLVIYMRAFRSAGKVAAERFNARTITAAAWVAPSNGELATGLTREDREQVERELQRIQDELTLLLLIPLGAIAATGLAEALTRRGEEVFAEKVLFDIQRIVQQGIDNKLSVSEVARELRESFHDLAPDAALSIARTQITALVNESSLRAAKAVDLAIYKTWVTAGDARVRPAHSQAAGQTKPLDSSFQVGGSSLQYPGDLSGPMDMVANCRCVLTYTKKLTLIAAAVDHTESSMVAVYPTEQQRRALTREGGQPPDDLHVTLAFLPDGVQNVEAATALLAGVAAQFSVLSGTVGGIGLFAKGEDGAPQIALPDVVGLNELRAAVVQALDAGGIAYANEHGFCPHITLGYADDLTPPDESVIGQELTFDSLVLAIGPDHYPYPLTAAASSLKGGQMKNSVSVRFDTSAGVERMGKDDLARLGCFVARVACEKRWGARGEALRILTADANGENVGPSWRAVLGTENSVTPDGRMIGSDALEPRYFPLPFMALFETGPGGHEGAKLAGRIDAIEKEGANYVGSGVVDLGEAGSELMRLRSAGMPLGVSFDLAVDEFELRRKDDPQGEAIPEDEELDAFLSDEAIFVVTKGTILGATAAPMQAIDEANEIEILVEDGEGMPAVVRAHAALEIEEIPRFRQGVTLETTATGNYGSGDITIPNYVSDPAILRASASFPTFPPLAWFQKPDSSDGPKPITYSEEGQVSGWLAPWEGCHYGYSTCVPPPHSSYSYAYFMTGELKTAEGELIPVGKIMFCQDGGKHVDADPRMSAREAAKHYDDSTKLGAYVTAGEDEWGIWLAGAVRPGLTDEELQHLRANLPSGDWRPVGSSSELIAAFSVPVGGFAIPRADLYLAASANGPDRMQALIIRPGMVTEELTEGEIARTVRVLAARAHGPEALAELARS